MLANLNQRFDKTKINSSLGGKLFCDLWWNEILELIIVQKFIVSGKSENQWDDIEIGGIRLESYEG